MVLSNLADFLFWLDITNGNLIFPLSTEHKSDISEDVVGPGPAPSPCRTLCPTGLDSAITAFNTPSMLAIYELFFISLLDQFKKNNIQINVYSDKNISADVAQNLWDNGVSSIFVDDPTAY